MTSENLQKGNSLVVSMALSEYRPICMIQEGEDIRRAIPDIFEFLQTVHHFIVYKIRRNSFQNLDTRTLIEEEKVFGGIHIQSRKMLHFWEKIGISNMKKILG